jgi:hypothetical protein
MLGGVNSWCVAAITKEHSVLLRQQALNVVVCGDNISAIRQTRVRVVALSHMSRMYGWYMLFVHVNESV